MLIISLSLGTTVIRCCERFRFRQPNTLIYDR